MYETKPRALIIPPPREDRPPLRANVFSVMQKANTTLAPLFPYLHPGAIVPAGALIIGGPGKDYGQFFHHNSVDEVIIAFVANGATLETGQLYNGGRMHGVNSFLKDQTRPGTFALFTITQRQLEEGAQPEAVTMVCSSCRKEIFRGELDGASTPDLREIDRPFQAAAHMPTLLHDFNADPAKRTCPDCGHVNAPFPVEAWGWDRYATQSAVMAEGKKVLAAAAGAAK
jgi:hypothetical protein